MRERTPFLLAALLLPFTVGMSGNGVPKLLRYEHSDAFAWVAESEAFDGEGNLRADLFGPSAEPLKVNLAANSDGACHQFMVQPPAERTVRDTSLAEASANAKAIVTGEVVSTERGFYEALPGTLIGVRRGNGRPPRLAFLFIPAASFVTPRGALCSRSLANAAVPRTGDRLVAFSFDQPTDRQGLIHPMNPDRALIIERDGKRIYTPAQLQTELAGLQFDEIAGRLKPAAPLRQSFVQEDRNRWRSG